MLYFRNKSKGNLVEIYDDATTCELLDILQKKKECDMYIVNDIITEGVSSSRMDTQTCEVNYGKSTSGCRYRSNVDVEINKLDKAVVNVSVKDS